MTAANDNHPFIPDLTPVYIMMAPLALFAGFIAGAGIGGF